MDTLLIIFQLTLAILIVLIVLINVTKGSEYGAVFRGAEAIFGGEGPGNFLNKVTIVLVILFFINSLLLTRVSTEKHKSFLLPVSPPPAPTDTTSSPSQPTSPPPPLPLPPKEKTQ
ncbi:MAG: preprotein translocase subunit SecG [Thermodesulfobacteriaceae bacterium]|nr:preprotein translocase subunit SecG [Thermodesulfobacteriaceae bacterium]MCX8042261.1 preprotein translocase subunit SecG [Thermodesulfobacteriaceae bacterium]MDW8136689.1 preprotein translocase subunit SecG [Thermodesulfobacterium sp.]